MVHRPRSRKQLGEAYEAFMFVETLLKVVLRRFPNPCIEAIAATAINAAIKPYSIAVAARRS